MTDQRGPMSADTERLRGMLAEALHDLADSRGCKFDQCSDADFYREDADALLPVVAREIAAARGALAARVEEVMASAYPTAPSMATAVRAALEEPDHCESCPFAGCAGCRYDGTCRNRGATGAESDERASGVVRGHDEGESA